MPTYYNTFSGSGDVTFQSDTHPKYHVTINGSTTADMIFGTDQTTFSGSETSSATAHFQVTADSTGGFRDFDATESDTESVGGSINSFNGLFVQTGDATARFSGGFNADRSSITGTVVF